MDPTTGALQWLVQQGGGYAIAALLLVVIGYLYRELQKARTDCEVSVKAQFEKRLEEFKVIVDALNRSSEALATMRVTVEARTEAINSLVAGFASLVRDLENNRSRWADKGELWSRQLADLQARMEDLQRRIP